MGFDNECIPNIQYLAGEYFCPVCRMLVYPNEAIQSQCTHLYCIPCLMYVISTTRACPYDGYLVTQEDSKPLLESNKTLAETIGKIVVHCLYHRSGCTWKGPLSDCPSHCSACAFGNSPVVCNRCAIQIVHRQVQEHAQTCPGVQSQAQPGEGFLTSTASTITNQMQVSVHGATASSQAQASHIAAAVVPGKVLSQAAISNPDFPPVAQASQLVSDLSLQHQHYPQYAGYDPYLQHYQQYYQQHGVQQYQEQQIQNPPLRPQLQVHSLPAPAAQPHTQGQIFSQQQPQAVLHTEPPALPMPLAQNHPQSQAIAAGQQQPHPMMHPQSHIHSQSHSLARPPLLNQPQLHPHAPPHSQLHLQQVSIPHQQNQAQAQAQAHIHLHAHSSVQPQQVHSQTYPSQTNYLTQYPPVHATPGHHSYSLQSQSGITQQPGLHSYLQGDLQQQQQRRAVPVQSQVSQQIMNPTQILGLNQQRPSVLPSSNEHQIVPTGQQQNIAQQIDFMRHHHPSVQAIGQPLAPHYQQQQVPVTALTPMHSQLRTNVPLLMPRQFGEVMQPQQNVAFPHSELPYQSQSQIGRTRVQLQEYPVTNGGVNQKSLTPGGSGQHSDTQIRSDSHPQTVAEQQSTYLQPVVRAQSDPNYLSAENSAARVRLEGRETPTVNDKSSEAFPSTSASRTGAPSNEKGLKDERMNHSEELISVGGSGSVASDFKEGDPNKVESKIMDPQSNLSANGTDERFSTVALVSEKYESKASVEGLQSDSKLRLVHQSHYPPEVPQSNINQTSLNHGLTQQTSQSTSVSGLQPGKVTDHSLRDPSDVRQPSGNHGTQFRRVTGVPSEPETSLIPSSVVHSAPNHMPPLVSQSTGPFPPVLDPDGRLTVKASPYAFEERTSMSTGLSANSRSSFDGNQPYSHHSVSGSSANPTTASLKSGPNWLNATGWRDERFRAPQDKILQEQGSQRVFKDLMQFPRLPAMVSENFRKQGQIFSSMPFERESFGFNMIPRPLDKALYGLCHDDHVQPSTFPEDNRPDLRRDFRSAPSMYGHHLRVPLSGSNLEHPNMSAHTVRYGDSRADFRLGIDGKDHNLFAPVKPFNLSSQSAELSFINSKSLNLLPHLHRGSYSGQAHNAELAGHGSIPPPPSGIGFRSNFLPTENRPYVSDLELSDNLRKRNTVTMGWCRICKVDCETVEGLDLHSQTREHQRMSMDMVLKIKQQNSKRQKLISND